MSDQSVETTQAADEVAVDERDSSDFAEHLRFTQFVLIAYCLVIGLAVPAFNQSAFRRARASAREIISLEPILGARGGIIDDGYLWGWSEQKWLRDGVRETRPKLLPKGPLNFNVADSNGKDLLALSVLEQFRWYVYFPHVMAGPEGKVSNWTVAQWAEFWDSLRDAKLEVAADTKDLHVRGHLVGPMSGALAKGSGWKDLVVVPFAKSYDYQGWTGFVTNDPSKTQDPDEQGADYASLNDSVGPPSWAYVAPNESQSSRGDISVDGLELNTNATDFDVQQLLAARAISKWRSGTFAESFPELSKVTEGQRDLKLSELSEVLAKREQSGNDVLKVADIELKAGTLGLWGNVVLLAIQAYFLMNLSALTDRLTADDAAWQFPWIVLYRTPLSYALSIMTICVAPVVLGGWLLPQVSLAYCPVGDWLCEGRQVGISLLSVALAIATAAHLHRRYRRAEV